MARVLLLVFSVWCSVAALFGLQLYFSLNNGFANPIVHPLVPLAKDAFWLLTLLVILAAAWKKRRAVRGRLFLCVTALSTFALTGLAFATYCRTGCDYAIFPLVKNLLLYSCGAVLAGYLLANLDLDVPALRIVSAALALGLLASALLFLTVEYAVKVQELRSTIGVPILRLFGTFGSPNSAGWAAVLSAPLILLTPDLFSRMNRKGTDVAVLAALTVSFVVLFFSSSLSALLGMGVTLLVVLALEQRPEGRTRIIFHAGVAGTLGLGVALALADVATPGYRLDVVTRLILLVSGVSTDSVSIRLVNHGDVLRSLHGFWLLFLGHGMLSAPQFQQYDSTALTFLANFGLVGVILFLAPYLYVLWVIARPSTAVASRDSELSWRAFMPLYVSFISVDFLLQHQLQLFPVNFFFYFLMGLCVGKVSRYPAEPGRS